MNEKNRALFEAALALPDDERDELLELLIESISPEPPDMTDEELYAELERRRAESERDPSTTIPWSELKNQE
jgi:putative addiction module component (TIGR02574 family)